MRVTFGVHSDPSLAPHSLVPVFDLGIDVVMESQYTYVDNVNSNLVCRLTMDIRSCLIS